MSFDFSFDPEHGIIRIDYHGTVTLQHWAEAHREMMAHDDGNSYANARYIVTDYTDASLSGIKKDDLFQGVRGMALKSNQINANITAITITPNVLDYGLMRMLEGRIDNEMGWESHIVRSREESEEYLPDN